MGDHDGVAAAISFRIFFGAAKHFAYEVRHTVGMVFGHLPEDRTDEVVFQDFVVEDPEKVLQGNFTSGPLSPRVINLDPVLIGVLEKKLFYAVVPKTEAFFPVGTAVIFYAIPVQ